MLMVSEGFQERLDIKQMISFLLTGSELLNSEDEYENEDLNTRFGNYQAKIKEEIKIIKDKILETDFKSLNQSKIDIELESIFTDLNQNYSRIYELYFELGFTSGNILNNQFNKIGI